MGRGGKMKIGARKAIGAVILLTFLIWSSCRDNKPLVWETIHEAAKKGDLQDVKRHLNRGAAVNAKDADGLTPLLFAFDGGHKDIVELLIAKGADVNAQTADGFTPLQKAVENHHMDVAELLKKHGAK
jgi:ankyrin repeat protein